MELNRIYLFTVPAILEISMNFVHKLSKSLVSKLTPYDRLIPFRFKILTIPMTSAWVTFMSLRCDEVQLPIIQVQFVFKYLWLSFLLLLFRRRRTTQGCNF